MLVSGTQRDSERSQNGAPDKKKKRPPEVLKDESAQVELENCVRACEGPLVMSMMSAGGSFLGEQFKHQSQRLADDR